jgi:hypothetical protein
VTPARIASSQVSSRSCLWNPTTWPRVRRMQRCH